jgi:hypothetical protein
MARVVCFNQPISDMISSSDPALALQHRDHLAGFRVFADAVRNNLLVYEARVMNVLIADDPRKGQVHENLHD